MKEASDSGLPPGWAETAVGNLVGYDGIFCDGDWVESKDQDPAGDVRLIQLADVGDGTYRDKSNRFLTSSKAAELRCTYLQAGDLLVARMPDPLGRACLFPGDTKASVTVVDVCIVRLSSPVHSRWLMHQLNTPQMRQRVAALQSGSTRKRISRVNFAKIGFPLPPVEEQGRIADALDELLSDLDAGVAALERVRGKLKLYRAAVLKAAVEGALTAELRKQHSQAEPASELLKRILAERRRRWEEEQLRKFKEKGCEPPKNWKAKYKEPVAPDTTGLPSLPEGWCWASIDQLGEVGTGATPNRGQKAHYYNGGTVPWVTSGCVNAPLVREATEFVTPKALEECNLTLYPAGTVLLAMYGEGKTRGKCSELLIASTTNQALAAIQLNEDLKGYLKVFLAKNYDQTRRSASGGVQPNLNLSVVREIALPLPPRAEQELIVEAVEGQLSIIDHLESDLAAKLTSAQALRQSILRHAFSGKLVPQNPNDEPASKLLKRIAAECEQRTREAATAKRLNGHEPRRAAKLRGKAARAKATKKETEHGRIADR